MHALYILDNHDVSNHHHTIHFHIDINIVIIIIIIAALIVMKRNQSDYADTNVDENSLKTMGEMVV
jgi:hypothetical protein